MADLGADTSVGRASSPKKPEKEYWTLAQCKDAYLDYLRVKDMEILEQQQARRYRHGVQWTSDEITELNLRKQPVVTFNRIGRKINGIVGLIEKLKQDPKGFPLNSRSEQGAELATAAVRSVVQGELRENILPFIASDAAVDGIGGVEIILTKGDRGDPDISFARIHPDSFFYDPTSYEVSFDDCMYLGQGKWMPLQKAQLLFPKKKDELQAELVSAVDLTSAPDRENRWYQFADTRRRLIRVCDVWYQMDGTWCWSIFTGGQILDEGETYLFDEKKRPIPRYCMFSAFIDHDGDRYGFVRDLKSSQDEINQRRSKGLHELNARRIFAEEGAFDDIEKARQQAVRPDGVVIKNKGFEAEFDDQVRLMNVEGQLKFLEDAKNEIENFGPSPALIGQGLEYKSGRAISLLQQAGIAELGPFVINYRNWKLRLYRIIWSTVQRYWTGERFVRVSDDEGIAQLVQVNGVGIDPQTGLPRLVNALGNLDVEIVLDEGPDEVNMMADAYDTLTTLAGQGAQIPPQVLLELAPLQQTVKRKLQAMMQQKDPLQDRAKAAEVAGLEADVSKTQSETALNQAKAAEAAQGGAHGIVERQMDAAMAQQEHAFKRDEHQMKMSLELGKLQTQREKAILDSQTQQIKATQDIQTTEARNAQSLRHGEEQHKARLAQARQKPKAKPASAGNGARR